MDESSDYCIKRSKSERDKYHMIILIHGLLKSGTNKLICKTNRVTDVENYGYQWETGVAYVCAQSLSHV